MFLFQPGQGLPQSVPQFRIARSDAVRFQVAFGLPRSDQIERNMDCGTAQITFGLKDFRRAGIASHQPDEDRLQCVFGVGRIAGDSVGGTEDHGVMIRVKPGDWVTGRLNEWVPLLPC